VILPPAVKIFVSRQAVDMRRGINSLSYLVKERWQADPYSGHMFLFLGKRRNSVKILIWDRNGFVLYYKRLSRGTFRFRFNADGEENAVTIDSTELAMLLDGIDYPAVNRPRSWKPGKK